MLNPNALLSELDALLAPGGHILIGTPNAANIDLTQPSLSDYYNEVHVPYHPFISTLANPLNLCCRQGWLLISLTDHITYTGSV